jgi:ABC-type multidrug transport system ATPase subunit
VTYNGHEMDEFVPQRTAAYISQHDLHIGEMTVRETLAFSARCQGVGSRYGKLNEPVPFLYITVLSSINHLSMNSFHFHNLQIC